MASDLPELPKSSSVFGKLQEKVAGVGRRLSLGPSDTLGRPIKGSRRRPRKGSSVNMVSAALATQMHTTVGGAAPLAASASFIMPQSKQSGGLTAAEMGNKTSSGASQDEEENERGAPPFARGLPLPASLASSGAETCDDGDLDADLPSIPRMEIFCHPMAAAAGSTAMPKQVAPAAAALVSALQHTATIGPAAEQHESSSGDWGGLTDDHGLVPPSPSPNPPDGEGHTKCDDGENRVARALRCREFVIRELVDTERLYVSDLSVIVDCYMGQMTDEGSVERGEPELPDDLKAGKDKIVFGNIVAIYEWHRDYFLKNVEDFTDHPESIGPVFQRSEVKFQMYVKYCENKPKSEYIVSEHFDYFEELRQKLGHKLQLPDLLIKPVQRLMKYQLLLRDMLKHTERAGLSLEVEPLKRALRVMTVVPKNADDMMNVGRLQGFQGKITAQGKLLLYGPLLCSEGDGVGSSFKGKELIVFLFEQSIILSECEGKKKQFTNQQYIYKNFLMVNKLHLVERVDPNEPLRFQLKSTGSSVKGEVSFICQGASTKERDEWVSLIRYLLQRQKDFQLALQAPIAYQKEQTRNGHTWLARLDSGALDIPSLAQTRPDLEPANAPQSEDALSPLSNISFGVSSFSSEAQRRQSDPTPDNMAQSPTKTGKRSFFRLPPLKSRGRRFSVDTDFDSKMNTREQRLTTRQQQMDERVSIEAGMNVKVLCDFNAIREDEISVKRGEVIQVLSCNQVRGFLVHRAATSVSPAAEGWVPSQALIPPQPTVPAGALPLRRPWVPRLRRQSDKDKDGLWLQQSMPCEVPEMQKRAVALINPYKPDASIAAIPYSEASCGSPDAPIKLRSPLANVRATVGSPVRMQCSANGHGVLAAQIDARWFGPLGEELIAPRFEMEQHRDGSFELHFSSAREDDAGEYTCVLSAAGYSVSCCAVLSVQGAS